MTYDFGKYASCMFYIHKIFTYEFIAKNNFLTVVCAKGGFYSPLYMRHMILTYDV